MTSATNQPRLRSVLCESIGFSHAWFWAPAMGLRIWVCRGCGALAFSNPHPKRPGA